MLILSWNCRGLARPAAATSLRALIRKYNPGCIFLSETKVGDVKMREVLGFINIVSIPAVKLAGGACLAWLDGVHVDVTLTTKNIINVLFCSEPQSNPWMFSAVYSPPKKKDKPGFWENLLSIGESFDGAWACLGDFNSISCQEDKIGGRVFGSSSQGGFTGFIVAVGLNDLGCIGYPLTWDNGHGGKAHIRQKLDRGLVNTNSRELFPKAVVLNIVEDSSDHSPLILNLYGEQVRKCIPFKFEEMWLCDRECSLIVENAWRSFCGNGSPAFKFCQKLRVTKKVLSIWNRDHFGHVQSRIKAVTANIEVINPRDGFGANLMVLRLEIATASWNSLCRSVMLSEPL